MPVAVQPWVCSLHLPTVAARLAAVLPRGPGGTSTRGVHHGRRPDGRFQPTLKDFEDLYLGFSDLGGANKVCGGEGRFDPFSRTRPLQGSYVRQSENQLAWWTKRPFNEES